MLAKGRFPHWSLGVLAFGLAVFLAFPASAQRYNRAGSGNFFGNLFGGSGPYQQRPSEIESAPQVDYSRAPAPKKPDPTIVPTTSIVVMGDSMADWLAYGLEDAFSDAPEIAVIRQNKKNSGLLRYEFKSDLDWWHAARDILSRQKADYVVMMLGVSDKQNIREKDLAKEADKQDADKKTTDDKTADKTNQDDDPDNAIIAPESQGKKANGVIEFRSDQWAEIYSRRIDATVAALKSKGVPVFWVGLPSIRGTRATADAVYLNDLYRARAERAGAVYIDVWDGFVDEGGKFTTQGPDFEGQVRRLRSGDGVYFTKAGARKLAHYVEREIRRYMNNRAVPVALPTGPIIPAPEAKSAVRPLAGPVLPLTVTPGNSDELAGGNEARPVHSDAIAASVLVKGDPVPAPAGRADDFGWPRGGVTPASAISAAASAAPEPEAKPAAKAQIRTDAKTETRSEPTSGPKVDAKGKPKVAKPAQEAQAKSNQVPLQQAPPRPPRPIGQSSGPFGLFR
jgi:uncharacterized protein